MPAPDPFEPNGRDAATEKPAASLFWHDPAALKNTDMVWYDPPVPIRQDRSAATEGLLDRLAALVGENARRSWLVKWTYHERTKAAAAEMEEVEAEAREELATRRVYAGKQQDELDGALRTLKESRLLAEEDLRAAHSGFAEAAANAGLTLPADGVTPTRVQAALLDIAPGLTEIAGENGVSPVEDHHWTIGGIVKAVFIFLAPWTAGFMLALCLGTLVGLLDLSVLRQPEQNRAQIVLAALLGFVIVYLMGEVVSGAVATLARGQETAAAEDTPRYRWGGRMAGVLLGVALLLVTAEITAETFGIRQLHQQHIIMLQRSAATNADGSLAGVAGEEGGQLLPLYVYALMGLLISGPYIAYKSSRAWSDSETQMREAWLLKHQRAWVDRKWATPDVQKSFRLAHMIQRLEAEIGILDARLKEARAERDGLQQADVSPETKARRNAARVAAVGESARLHQMVESLVEEGDDANPAPAEPDFRPGAREPLAPSVPEYPERV